MFVSSPPAGTAEQAYYQVVSLKDEWTASRVQLVRQERAALEFSGDEIPNDDLLAAMSAAEEYKRRGKMKFHSSVDDIMDALE